MKGSVIVPAWNGRAYLPTCLESLLAQDYLDREIIVVDNASADDSANLVAEHYPQVRLIRNARNLGFAGGCNAGLRVAQGDLLVLLNQDTRVPPGWLTALVAAFQDQQIGVAGCKTWLADGQTIQHAGGWIEWPLGIAHHYGYGEPDAGQWETPCPVEYVTGAAMAFRRVVLKQIGPFDESFWPGYFEDADFCFRARESGFEVWYVPSANLIHSETTSTPEPRTLSRFYQRGRLRFLLKHLPPARLLNEWASAELAYQPPAMRGLESEALRLGYLEALLMAPDLLRQRWQADETTIADVLAALQNLYRQAWQNDWRIVVESAAGMNASSGMPVQAAPVFPPLQEYEFRSAAPLIGPLIARVRSVWYGMAARWAVRYLTQQQEAINRQQEALIKAIGKRLTDLAEENALLAHQIACQRGRIEDAQDGR